MSNISIVIVNKSTVVSDDQAAQWAGAIQKQVSRDFAPLWDIDASVTFLRKGAPIPVSAWPCYLLDTADVAGALGYHDEGAGTKPFGRVFAKTTLADGEKVSVTLSHEILEMLGDPYVRLGVFVEDRTGAGRIYAYETADAVESDEYLIDGVAVSNFVTPHWFDPTAPKGTRLDFLGKVPAPFHLTPGGYISCFDVKAGSGWQQITARADEPTLPTCAHTYRGELLPKPGSRRDRRNMLALRRIL